MQHLKSKLTKQLIQQYLDFSKEFVLTNDDSNRGLGALLSQEMIGKNFPVAYANRSLNNAESQSSEVRDSGVVNEP